MSVTRPPWLVLVLAVAALLLGLLALSAGAIALTDHADATDRSMMLINLVTGVAGVVGAIGYALNKRSGLYLFGVSTLGHVTAHVQLYLTGIEIGRAGSILLFGLAIIPCAALCVLAGMLWTRWRQARTPIHRTQPS